MKSALYIGQVFHKRRRPAVHVLRYRVFSLLLNLDEIDSLQKRLWLFSRNRWNLFSFYDKDFGENPQESLSLYVNRKLTESGIEQVAASIVLSCYPRIVGYTFNPLSLFYCFDESGRVFAVLHEVHNTFGERHVYVLPVDLPLSSPVNSSVKEEVENIEKSDYWIKQTTQKELFVSPFAHMNMNYSFRLNVPGEKQVIVIHANDEHGHLLTASYTASRYPLSASRLLRCFVGFPALTIKVMLGIHWEALKLWLKKVPWFSHQAKTLK